MRTTAAAARRARRLVVVLVTSFAAMLASTLAYADGIDVSHWQGTINWSKVKAAGMQFAFMKATESTTYTDTAASRRTGRASQAVGIYRGAYHFARPERRHRRRPQAKYFVSKVGSFQGAGTLPPVLDLEASGGLGVTALRTWTATWLQTGRAAHRPHPDHLRVPGVLGALPRQQHGLHALPAVDRALRRDLAAGARRLADLDVLAAHQQRLGERHLRQRRHEPLQRHDARSSPRWRTPPAARPPRCRRVPRSRPASRTSADARRRRRRRPPAINGPVTFAGDLTHDRRRQPCWPDCR